MTDVLELDEIGNLEDEGGAMLTDLNGEQRLLAALIKHPYLTTEVRSLVSPVEFYDPLHRRLFEGILSIEGFEPDNSTMVEWVGGETAKFGSRSARQFIGYLRGLGEEVTPAEAVECAEHIFECADRRFTMEGQTNLAGVPFESKMGLVMWADRNSTATDLYDYLIEDTIPEKELSMIVGATQAGKSFLAFHMAMCLTRAVPFFGREILEPVPVVWCAYEGGRGARGRMLAYAKFHNIAAELPFAALTSPVDLWSNELNVDNLIKEIQGVARAEFAGKMPAVVFIDTHNAATPGASEIDSEAVSKIRDRYKRLVAGLGCAVIIIGHTNSLGKHRGNELLVNNVDTVITVTKKTVTKNRVMSQVRDDDNREIRTVDLWKQREGMTGHLFDFVLPAIETGIKNKFGKVRTSCVVTKPNWSDQAAAEANAAEPKVTETKSGIKLTDIEDHFFKTLWKQLQERGTPAPAELGLPSTVRVVHRSAVSQAFRDSLIPDDGSAVVSANTIKARWTRSSARLRKFGVISFKEPFFWWTGKPVMGMPGTQPQRSMFDDGPPVDREFPPDEEFS